MRLTWSNANEERFPMKKQLLLFLTAASSLFAAESPVFLLSGDSGFHAVSDGKMTAPLRAKELKTVPGIRGSAIAFGENGSLEFRRPASFRENRGTVLFWFKPDRDPRARYTTVLDRDRRDDGSIGPVGFSRRQIFRAGLRTSGNITYTESSLNGFGWEAGIQKFWFRDRWHLVVITWDSETKKSALFFNGLYFEQTDTQKREPFLDTLRFGAWSEKGLCGTIDEFTLYDRPLSKAEILKIYSEYRPYLVECHDFAWFAGKENRIRFRFQNISGSPKVFRESLEIVDPDGKKVFQTSFDLAAAPGKMQDVKISFLPEKAGLYRVNFLSGKTFEMIALSGKSVAERMKPGDLSLKRIAEIDCSADLGPGVLRTDGSGRVVRSSLGSYRETGNGNRNSFVVRLPVLKNPLRYHLLELEYPDNLRRTFGVTLYSAGNGIVIGGQMNGTGIFTGGVHPVTNSMQRKRLLWVPFSPDVMLICENYGSNYSERGGALSKLRLYEIDSDLLPALPNLPDGRKIGVWDEDCTMDATWFNMPYLLRDKGVDLEFWREKGERIAEYAHHMGYNLWTIQFMEYYGDRTGADLSLRQLKPMKVPGTQGHIHGCVDTLARIFEREKIHFYGRLGVDPFRGSSRGIIGGEECMAKDSSDFVRRGKEAVELVSKNGQIDRNAIMNPLHPRYIDGMKRILAFYRDRYQENPMFSGITLRDTSALHSLKNLDYGYDDYTVSLFEQETGIAVPKIADGTRFYFRWRFLTSPENREKWIAWRCRKLAEVSAELVRELRKGNNRLRLQVWADCITVLGNGWKKNYSAIRDLREAGFDFALLEKIDGLDVVPIIRPDYQRVHALGSRVSEDYLVNAGSFADAFSRTPYRTLNLMLHNNLENYPSRHCSLPELFFPTADWVIRKKPLHFLSWCNAYPNAQEALLPLTRQLANRDVDEIQLGWWGNPDSGVTDQYRKFNQAFRSIPAVRFTAVTKESDCAAVYVHGKDFYVVNRMGYPVTLEMKTEGSCTDVVTGERCSSLRGILKLELPSQALRVFKGEGRFVPGSFRQTLSPEGVARFAAAGKKLRYAAQKEDSLAEWSDRLTRAAAMGNWPEARRILLHRVVERALEKTKNLKVGGRMLVSEKCFELTVLPQIESEKELRIELKGEKGIIPETRSALLKNLKPGTMKTLRFPLTKMPSDGSSVIISATIRSSKGSEQEFRYLCGGMAANCSGKLPEPGSDWSFKAYQMRKEVVDRPGITRYEYEIGSLWNEKGISIAVSVEDTDYFRPSPKLRSINADSLQVFLDFENRSDFNVNEYRGHELEFILSEGNGKAGVEICTRPVHWSGEGMRYAMIHKNGRTMYEVFLPARSLPGIVLKPGNTLGMCVMVNNRVIAKDSLQRMVTSPRVFPYKRPGTWPDLILLGPPEQKSGRGTGVQTKGVLP